MMTNFRQDNDQHFPNQRNGHSAHRRRIVQATLTSIQTLVTLSSPNPSSTDLWTRWLQLKGTAWIVSRSMQELHRPPAGDCLSPATVTSIHHPAAPNPSFTDLSAQWLVLSGTTRSISKSMQELWHTPAPRG